MRLYSATCPKCQKDNGFKRKSRINSLCKLCCDQKKIGTTPWNKGGTISQEIKAKISMSCLGRVPSNKEQTFNGIPQTYEHRRKISCSLRGIPEADFSGFIASETQRERAKFNELGLHLECFKRDNFTCLICNKNNLELKAHHVNAWNLFPEERFLLDNLATLCSICHENFHSEFGRGHNTKEQFALFKSQHRV